MDATQIKRKIKSNLLTSVLILLLVVAGIYLFVFSADPKIAEAENFQLQSTLSDIRYNISNSKSLEDDLVRSQELVDFINNGLLDPDSNTANLRYFYEIADQQQVVINRTDFKEPAAQPLKNFDLKTLLLDVQGPFDNVLNWYKTVQSGKFFLKISSFTITGIVTRVSQEDSSPPTPEVLLQIEFQTITEKTSKTK